MEFTAVLAWLTLLVGVPLCVTAALLLLKKSRARPDLRVLRQHFRTCLSVTIVVAFFGVVFVNNDQLVPPMDLDTTKLITRLAVLGLAVAVGAGWIWLYWSLRKKS